jgi:hypothetical protein
MFRTKLNLTEAELMNKTWISLCIESADLPWYDYHGKDVITDPAKANSVLSKYIK